MGIFYFNSQNKPEFSGYKEDRFHLFSKSHEIHILTAYNIFKSNLIVGVGPKILEKNVIMRNILSLKPVVLLSS